MEEDAETELANRVNNLANLYVQAFYQYRFLANMLENSANLKNSANNFKIRSEMAQRNAQVLLDYMHRHGLKFRLTVSQTLDAHFDARRVSEIDDHLRGVLDDLVDFAHQENKKGLSTLLAPEDAESTSTSLDIPIIAGEHSPFRSETLSIEYEGSAPSTSASMQSPHDAAAQGADVPGSKAEHLTERLANGSTEAPEDTSNSNATPSKKPEGKKRKSEQAGKRTTVKKGKGKTQVTATKPDGTKRGSTNAQGSTAKNKQAGKRKTVKKGKTQVDATKSDGTKEGRKRGSTNAKGSTAKKGSVEEKHDTNNGEISSTSGIKMRSGRVKSSEADTKPAAVKTKRGKGITAKGRRSSRKGTSKVPRKKNGRSEDSTDEGRDLAPVQHPTVTVEHPTGNEDISVIVEQDENEIHIRCAVSVDIVVPK